MFYEIDANGNKIRPLPGYFEGFKDDLKDVDPALLSDFQSDYMSIPDGRIVRASEEEHDIFITKKEKLQEISSAFNSELAQGHFFSETLQIEVDCRRSGEKNDLQNVQGLISHLERNKATETLYVGYSETVPATVEQLKLLCTEMEDHVLALYHKKWQLEEQVKNTNNAELLKNIKWNEE